MLLSGGGGGAGVHGRGPGPVELSSAAQSRRISWDTFGELKESARGQGEKIDDRTHQGGKS